ncbi:response regulator [Acidicapsa dinghuensis]|uniref:Response regulator n=1 Tax=Acidicapsa dinghuensis TaxID=2218256 RepID=A0ABW1ELU0_9BACT|nr:response regulator [Acidicapsa dinghuensis]
MSSNRRSLIFIVDDHDVIASTLTEILNVSGFECVGFSDPLKALQAIESNAPDVLIADALMPKMSGIQLALRTKTLSPSTKVLILTALMNAGELDQARGHDFDVLQKPISPPELIRMLNSLCPNHSD